MKYKKIHKSLEKSRKCQQIKKIPKISKNHETTPTKSFFSNLKICKTFFVVVTIKKKMLSSQFCHLRRLVVDKSSPVHPVSDSRGDPLSVTQQQEQEDRVVAVRFLIQDASGRVYYQRSQFLNSLEQGPKKDKLTVTFG